MNMYIYLKKPRQRLIVYCLTLICFFTLGYPSYAQKARFDRLLAPESEPGWLILKDDLNLKAQNIFDLYAADMGLSQFDRMELINQHNDELGMSHFRFQQFHKGVKIDGAEVIAHEYNGRLKKLNGKWITNLSLSSVPAFSAEQAIEIAKAYVGAKIYMWEDSEMEAEVKELRSDPFATYFPKGELLFIPPKSVGQKVENTMDNYRLVYKIEIYAKEPESAQALYIDAGTGQVIDELPLEYHCGPITWGNTTWHGVQYVNSFQQGNGSYILKSRCTEGTIHTRYYRDSQNNEDKTDYVTTTRQWINDRDRIGLTSHWAARIAQLYFKNIHGRDGWNNKAGGIKIYNHASFRGPNGTRSRNNASWNNGVMKIGSGGGSDPMNSFNTLDIVGHELTHGVVGSSSNLVYRGESGALNESFADIFGNMIEEYVEEENFDWRIGEDRGGAIRDMTMPAFYKGSNWVPTTPDDADNDWGGVHSNSSVQNYWFYLISEGNTGINENGDAYDIQGIGVFNARRIAYRALTVYLTKNSQYIDARNASIQAAKDLFGNCANEVIQVANAWLAVGVGQQLFFYDRQLCGYISDYLGNANVKAINTITTGGDCISLLSGNATFLAGQEIILKPGFHAPAGSSILDAKISECVIAETSARYGPPLHWNDYLEQLQVDIPAAERNTLAQLTSFPNIRAYPNPSQGITTVEYQLIKASDVSIRVLNAQGQEVRKLVDESQVSGLYKYSFIAHDLPNGIYMVVLETNTGRETVKLVLHQ